MSKMMLQLDPPIPVWVPARRQAGYCVGWIDYSQEHTTLWKVILQDGTIWDLPQSEVRGQENVSLERPRDGEGSVMARVQAGWRPSTTGEGPEAGQFAVEPLMPACAPIETPLGPEDLNAMVQRNVMPGLLNAMEAQAAPLQRHGTKAAAKALQRMGLPSDDATFRQIFLDITAAIAGEEGDAVPVADIGEPREKWGVTVAGRRVNVIYVPETGKVIGAYRA